MPSGEVDEVPMLILQSSYSSVLKDSLKKSTPATPATSSTTPSTTKPPLKRAASHAIPITPPVAKKIARAPVRKVEERKPDPIPAKPPPKEATTEPLALNPRQIVRAPAQHGIRYRYILKLSEELTRLYKTPKDLETKNMIVKKTLDTEEEIATTKRTIYTSAMGRYIMRLTKLTPEQYAKELEAEAAKNAPAPAPAAAPRTNRNADPPLKTGFTPETEILCLQHLVHPLDILKKWDYTLTPPSDAEIAKAKDGLAAANNYEECDRCKQRFQVFPGRRESDGALTTCGECIYHSGKPGRRQGADSQWTCCGRTVGGFDRGCKKSPTHVYYVGDNKRLASYFPYIKTPENPAITTPRALAFDCEMCYTTMGMEVCRLTATAFPTGELVIDALVRPFGEVLDFNSQFSGVTAEMMTSAVPYTPQPYPDPTPTSTFINPTGPIDKSAILSIIPSPEEARAALCAYINPDTVLVGHALNNDLTVLRLCHEKVVDTMVLFPHTRGFPLRNRLKYLVLRFLEREIQVEGDPAGHDSAVDARCAAELCRLKIRQNGDSCLG